MTAYIIFAFLVACFSSVLLFGAPYLPTHKKQIELALDLLDLKKGQTLFELGCGDGRVLLLAAKRGLQVVGYEMNPLMVVVARTVTWRHRKLVSVRWGSFWRADLSKADGVYVFLLDRFMKKLDKKLSQELRTDVMVASYAFKIPGKKPANSTSGVYLYKY